MERGALGFFVDRKDAGQRLAKLLVDYDVRHPVVLALPRGGVPVAFEIAKALSAPLDLVLVRKIGAPWQPELAIGAVADGPRPFKFLNRDLIDEIGISDKFLKAAIEEKLREIEKRRRLYLGDKPQVELAGRCVIVVDDGIATGATVRVALKAVRDNRPEEVVLAVPLAPMDSIEKLQKNADVVHCVITPELFGAISIYYRDFRQVSDEEVVAYLKAAANRFSQ